MDLTVGEKYKVVAERILERGIVARLEDGTTQFIHISQLSDRFVKNISDVITVGEEYEASCIVSKVKGAELSLRKEEKYTPKKFERPAAQNHEAPNRYNNWKPAAQQQRYVPKQGTPDLEQMIKKMNKDFESKRRKDYFAPKRNSRRKKK